MTRIILIRNAYAHDFGGGERFPVFLAESLGLEGHEAVIVSRNQRLLNLAGTKRIHTIRGWWWSAQNWSGWRTALFPIYAIWQFALYCWYRQLFHRLQPDVVHIQSKDDFIAATYAAKHTGCKIIWTDHADLKHIWINITAPLKNPIGKWVYRAAAHTSAITVVSGSELKEVNAHLPESSPIAGKLTVVYNGCADVYANYPHPPTANVTYVIANRLVTDKGIGEAITAFKQLNEKHPDTSLIIAGDGPERETFAAQASNHPSIALIGYQSDPYGTIAKADVFLQPTYHEGFSIVLVEASMLQKAIIATAVGGNVEIIRDNETGLLVPARDASALAGAMEKLYADENLRTQLAQKARAQYEEKFVFDKIVKEGFIPLYD